MTTREDILNYVKSYKEHYKIETEPIYILHLFENPNKELIYTSGKHSGFPDTGSEDEVGFFYNIDDAIHTMHENITDIRETVYNVGFILCKFQGTYETAGTEARMYFVWDEEKQGFFEQEEPPIFKHVAY